MPDQTPRPETRTRARAVLDALLPGVRARAVDALGPVEGEGLAARLEQHHLDLLAPLDRLYVTGDVTLADLAGRLVDRVVTAAIDRPVALRALDRRREVDPGWFQRARMVGYVGYADRFAGDLAGVRRPARLPGRARRHLPAPDAAAGTARGRQRRRLRGRRLRRGRPAAGHDGRPGGSWPPTCTSRGMSLCVDLVLNHTAAEHPWALAAAAGDPAYRGLLPDLPRPHRAGPLRAHAARGVPRQRPRQLHPRRRRRVGVDDVQQLPVGPGLVQPRGLRARCSTRCSTLANHGVDVLRLDAAPFLWKREGTDCQNQPEVHLILQALRALVGVAAPGVAFKAEAIVAPQQLVQYLGAHDRFRPECDLAYNNQLMVMLWSSLATRDTTLARRRPRPDAAGSAVDGLGHLPALPRRHRLGGLRRGRVGGRPRPGRAPRASSATSTPASTRARSPAARCSRPTRAPATAASRAARPSLCGLEAARESRRRGADRRRGRAGCSCSTRVVYSFGGIPLLYMGDELALRNDPAMGRRPGARRRQPVAAPAADGLGRGRPARTTSAPWRAGVRRAGQRWPGSGPASSRCAPATGPSCSTSGDRHVLGYVRRHPRGARWSRWLPSPTTRSTCRGHRALPGFVGRRPCRARRPRRQRVDEHAVHLPAWGYAWLVGRLARMRYAGSRPTRRCRRPGYDESGRHGDRPRVRRRRPGRRRAPRAAGGRPAGPARAPAGPPW